MQRLEAVTAPRAPRDKRSYQLVDLALRTVLRHVPPSSYTESIALRWGYAFHPAPRVVTLRSGLPMQVDPSEHLQILLYYLGTFESHCLRWLRALLPDGGTFLDLGANIGLYTLEGAACVGPHGRVISVEAAPMHLERLRANIDRCGFENVSVVPVAVGPCQGRAKLSLPPSGNLGMFTIGTVPNALGIDVPVRPLDEVLRELAVSRLDVVKIDIEGAELGALRGGREVIGRDKPAFLAEINAEALARCGASAAALRGFFEEQGYHGWLIGRGGLEPLPDPGSHVCEECLFIHPSRSDQMRCVTRASS